ncbi:MAG: His/Gly/Thr/Pro-type tRNA ligase C-terminal domain-containing protein [Anaerobutyricum sp.]
MVRDIAVRMRLQYTLLYYYDFDSVEDGVVTVRDRDTMEQERIKIEDLRITSLKNSTLLVILRKYSAG